MVDFSNKTHEELVDMIIDESYDDKNNLSAECFNELRIEILKRMKHHYGNYEECTCNKCN